MISLLCYLISGILLVLIAFGISGGPVHLGWLGAALVAFGLMVGGLPPRSN